MVISQLLVSGNFKQKKYQTSLLTYVLFNQVFILKSSCMTSYINLEQNSNISQFTRNHHCGVPSTRQSHRSLHLVLQVLNRWQTNPHTGKDGRECVRDRERGGRDLGVVLYCVTTKIRLRGTQNLHPLQLHVHQSKSCYLIVQNNT